MKIEIFFRDLVLTKQEELLKAWEVSSPDEINISDIPIAIIEIEPEPKNGETANEH